MSHTATLHVNQPAWPHGASVFLSTLVVAWLAVISWFGAAEVFVAPAGAPPLRLLLAVWGPVIAFLLAYRTFPAVRELVAVADLRFITATQAWRFGGFAFLALTSYHVLPGYFAWPAGVGDMAIAAAVPWMLAGLTRDPRFSASRRFVVWNLLGVLDLVVAVSIGAVVPLLFPRLAGEISTSAMTHLPLVLIPGFFVPGYLILHAIALLHARRAASAPPSTH